MLELLTSGGWVMVPLILMAVVATAITLERSWSLRRSEVLPHGISHDIETWSRGKTLDNSEIQRLKSNSPLGELLAGALYVRHKPREVIKERIEDVGRHVSHDLNRFLPTLGTIASVSPLLGLLGTVTGMITMFLTILETGVGDANQLAGGIGQALISTAGGLCIAIPTLLLHRYFRGKVAGYVIEMEKVAMNLLDVLEAKQVESDNDAL
jgi:biopolymer transport protein ExbB